MPCIASSVDRHDACIGPWPMTTHDTQPSPTSSELRRQEMQFYEALMALHATLPKGSTVAEALATKEGQRIRTRWMLKYGRPPPL